MVREYMLIEEGTYTIECVHVLLLLRYQMQIWQSSSPLSLPLFATFAYGWSARLHDH